MLNKYLFKCNKDILTAEVNRKLKELEYVRSIIWLVKSIFVEPLTTWRQGMKIILFLEPN